MTYYCKLKEGCIRAPYFYLYSLGHSFLECMTVSNTKISKVTGILLLSLLHCRSYYVKEYKLEQDQGVKHSLYSPVDSQSIGLAMVTAHRLFIYFL